MNPNIPAHMVDAEQAYPVGDDECMDADGEVWPEHDFPPEGQGDECRRCNAQADGDEESEEELDRRLHDALGALRDALGTN